jgi:hypothetical protein
MGRPIVYCGICGKSLKEDDFSKGRAHLVDNAPFCVTCRIVPEPLAKPTPAAPPLAPPRPSGVSSKALPAATPRRHQSQVVEAPSSSMGLVIGIGVVVLLIIIVAVVLLNTGGPSAPPPALPTNNAPPPRVADPVRPTPPKPPGPEDDGQGAIQGLEAFATTSTHPQAILDRCEELRSKLRGTPYLPRLEAVEARALEARRVRDRDRQLTMSLENVQKLRDVDPKFERREEIESILNAAIGIAGPRKAEVEKILADYRKAAAAGTAQTPDRPAPPSRLGPFEQDDAGAVRHWLVLGPFGNRKAPDGLQDNDLLKTETDHVPAAGQEVLTREGQVVRWTPITAPDSKVLFRSVEPLGLAARPDDAAIVFAACWLGIESDSQVKFRMVVDSGCQLYLDHKRIWNHSRGKGLNANEEVLQQSLSAGLHLVLLKVATVGGGDFGFRMRVMTPAGERPSGIQVWNQVPVAPRILISENFNQGRGVFATGEVVPGGVGGTTALAIPRGKGGVFLDRKLAAPAGSSWTLRFKLKPSTDLKELELIAWAGREGSNFRYHLRNLKKDQWNQLEIKAAQLHVDWSGKGPSFEGEVLHAFRIYYDDNVPDGSVLLDDFEILE